MKENKIKHSENKSLRDKETVESGTYWYNTENKKTYLAVNTNLLNTDRNLPDRLLFSLVNGNVYSFENTFGKEDLIGGRSKFVQVTKPFTVTPFPTNE